MASNPNNDLQFPYEVPAIKVIQPIGVFYVAVLPAKLLLDVAFSHALTATYIPGSDTYQVDGTQRLPQPKRLQPIADYINRDDAAFPNSIILAANYRDDDGLIEDSELESADAAMEAHANREWVVIEKEDGTYKLLIPSPAKLAAIIDGQHRIFAFAEANPPRRNMELVCSIFLDLPKPFQAQIFASINSNQKPVDKSLTYEMFGYNVEEESEEFWSPDKLAVFLTRKLSVQADSPLKGKIVIAPKRDRILSGLSTNAEWKVSTAVVVEGIMRLFTSNPKKDISNLLDEERKPRNQIRYMRNDRSPLREAYLNTDDKIIYTMVFNYLKACNSLFWENAKQNSFIVRTVGIQALFDVLRALSAHAFAVKDISESYFVLKLTPAKDIDFSTDYFRNASGSGRSAIRKAIMNEVSSPVSKVNES
jgi:DNA phosphorothioation-associated DGQHR protein 1